MFTGIIETIGSKSNDSLPNQQAQSQADEKTLLTEAVESLKPSDGGATLTITDASEVLSDAKLGDSISVNGKWDDLLLLAAGGRKRHTHTTNTNRTQEPA
jgi:riboflavin synthase alpha subunit